jgi:DNA-binding CsgD family transcriptional regulator
LPPPPRRAATGGGARRLSVDLLEPILTVCQRGAGDGLESFRGGCNEVGGTEVKPELIGALHRLACSVLLVDPEARPLFAIRAAEALLAEGGSLRLERARLSARRVADTFALRRLIAATTHGGGGGSLVISRDARASLILLVLPLRDDADAVLRNFTRVALVFVKDLEAPLRLALSCFAEHFKLTPAQAMLANEIACGDGVGAAARRLGISYATARTQLLQIFGKTEARRQGQLIRMMMAWDVGVAVAQRGLWGRIERPSRPRIAGAASCRPGAVPPRAPGAIPQRQGTR